jgi:predicted ThiF/HesA family dinucleotide-utilizing enzyme
MNNIKSFFVIDKDKVKGNIHIVGVGALGSKVAENLMRLNLVSKMIVYDMDTVEEKNLNNQVYNREHIGMAKVEAIKQIASTIDSDATLRIKNKKVDSIRTKDEDIVILAIDNFQSRGKILAEIEGNPLVISGGVSSIGGNFEVVRGKENYKILSKEYLSLESGKEYDENDLTPCGSPISIYPRIGFASCLMAEAVIQYHDSSEEMNKNIVFDIPNLTLFEI